MFGGNSNWRGPVWMPVNALLIRALLSFYLYYGDNFRIECPTRSGNLMNLFEVAREIANRVTRIFLRDASGRRPVYGASKKFQSDPLWKDYLLFYEYFHGDNGAGLGGQPSDGLDGHCCEADRTLSPAYAEQLLAEGRSVVTGGKSARGVPRRCCRLLSSADLYAFAHARLCLSIERWFIQPEVRSLLET